ncbi:MAG: TraM recognition domain-containing protein [Deltaproteobacteria bacterium]|nr:TraM recognition domain-containing protein [Deltaproteobacteria bacterium]
MRRPRRPVYLMNVSAGDPVQVFNPFLDTAGDPSVVVDRCIEATVKSWGAQNTDDTPRLEKWLRLLYTLIVERGLSIAEAELVLAYEGRGVRRFLAEGTSVEAEWRQLDHAKTPTQFDDQIGSAKNRLQRFYAARSVRRFLSVTDPSINLDLVRFMDAGGILLVNLQPSATLSPMNARLFGTLLVTRIFDAARRRELPDGGSPRPCYCYLDEFQNFVTLDVAEMLAQSRKTGLALTLAHQTLEQARAEDPRILAALHGAARTKISFTVGSNADATELVHELLPGQLDYNETKRVDTTTKFRPFTRWVDIETHSHGHGTTHAKMHSHSAGTSEGHTHASGRSSGSSVGDSFGTGSGMHVPVDGGTGTFSESDFQGSTSGEFEGNSEMSSDIFGMSESDNEGVVDGESETTSESVTRTPITEHEEFTEDKVTVYSLDDQRQRAADSLRCLPDRTCIVRLPDGTAHRVTVHEVKPVPLSRRRVTEYEAEVSRKSGALPAAQIEQMIQDRRRQIEQAAGADFDDAGVDPVHSKGTTYDEPVSSRPQGTRPFSKPGRKPRSK